MEHRSKLGRPFGVKMAAVVACIAAFSAVPIATAVAQTDPYSTKTPEVLPTRIEDPDGEVQADVQERGSSLPFTGADITLFAVTGAAAVGTGAMVVKRSKRG